MRTRRKCGHSKTPSRGTCWYDGDYYQVDQSGDALKSVGRFACHCSISAEVRSPFWAPICCTTEAELMRPRRSASSGARPFMMYATVVEEVAAPAPVREIGGAGSGYIGANHEPLSVWI